VPLPQIEFDGNGCLEGRGVIAAHTGDEGVLAYQKGEIALGTKPGHTPNDARRRLLPGQKGSPAFHRVNVLGSQAKSDGAQFVSFEQ
jgi:hypothetical protein